MPFEPQEAYPLFIGTPPQRRYDTTVKTKALRETFPSSSYEARVWAEARAHSAQRGPISVLLVSPYREDHQVLRTILPEPGFQFASAFSVRGAIAHLRQSEIAVVIAECQAPRCCWKDVLRAINTVSRRPPRLLVASKAEDDCLWSEVAELGADSILIKPFQRDDVVWEISDAWIMWSRQHQSSAGRRTAVAGA